MALKILYKDLLAKFLHPPVSLAQRLLRNLNTKLTFHTSSYI
jgi:hypothetical protein